MHNSVMQKEAPTREKDISTYTFLGILFPMKFIFSYLQTLSRKILEILSARLCGFFLRGVILHGFIKWKAKLVALFQYSLLYSYSANKMMLIIFLFKVADTYNKTSLMNVFFLLKLGIPE